MMKTTLLTASLAVASTVALGAQSTADKTKNAVVKGVTVAADKTKEGLSTTGEVMTDGWITSRVHQRFVGEDLLKGSDISVDTDNHVVTLKGTVLGNNGRTRASVLAMSTEGVHRVINKLTIGPKHTSRG